MLASSGLDGWMGWRGEALREEASGGMTVV